MIQDGKSMEYIVEEGLKILMKSSSDFISYCFIKKQTLMSVLCRFPSYDNAGNLIYIVPSRPGATVVGFHQNKMRHLLIRKYCESNKRYKSLWKVTNWMKCREVNGKLPG